MRRDPERLYEFHAPLVHQHMVDHGFTICARCGGEVRLGRQLTALPCPLTKHFDPRIEWSYAIGLHCQNCRQLVLISPPPGALGFASFITTEPGEPPEWVVETMPELLGLPPKMPRGKKR